MICYKFNTNGEAQMAIDALNAHMGYPLGVTLNFASYIHVEDYFVIVFNEEMTPVLGQPIEINLDGGNL